MITVENLSFTYRKSKRAVLRDFSLSFESGRVYGLLGKNGAGKSTLLYLMSGLLTPKNGKVMFHDTDVRRRLPVTLQDMFLVPEEFEFGVMISNGIRLYKITGEQTYLDSAIASSEGAYNYFVRPLNGLALAYPDHDPWFTTKLIRAFIDIEPYYKNAGNYIKTFINFLDYAYENARLSNGLFYEDWTGATPKRAEQLLMQDAALESLGMIALYKGHHRGTCTADRVGTCA